MPAGDSIDSESAGRARCDWYFREMNHKQSRQGDIPTKHALSEDVKTFIREVLQNANDAGPVDPSKPVQVIFRFTRLNGDSLQTFKRAISWDDTLLPHLEAAAVEEKDLSLEQFIDRESEQLVLLTIEDVNTEGLSGEEDAEQSNYTALVRDMHRSNKDETQAGSHGVGGTVLWAFSGISSVLFTSVLNGDTRSPRFVGRSYLPDHVIDGQLYKGYGWFGKADPSDPGGRHISLWGDEARETLQSLGLVRPNQRGTSITIVGFREPGESQPDADKLETMIETFRTEAVKNFWPAIRRKELEVYVEGPADDSPRPADLRAVPEIIPFIKSYERLYDNDGELGQPGQINAVDIDFQFPNRTDGTGTPKKGEVTLSTRTAGPADEQMRNKVAAFRGAGMIVRYIDMSDIAKYGADFHAVLACGEARTGLGDVPSEVDANVERLLRSAEPAAHNKWTGTSKLKNEYSGRRVGLVEDLQGKMLRDSLIEMVSESTMDEGQRLQSLERLFPIGTGRGRSISGGISSRSKREIEGFQFAGDCWEFEVVLHPIVGTNGEWGARLWVTRLMEEGGDGEPIAIEGDSVSCDGGHTETWVDEEGRLNVHARENVDLRIRGRTVNTGPPQPTTGRSARTGIRHEIIQGGLK